jgi:2-dehydro-3-deoxyphosphogluconate aldolase/(4S)-4-hydroxy-2-oxoglutarate aldolase
MVHETMINKTVTNSNKTNRTHIANKIRKEKLVAIIRLDKQKDIASVVKCLISGGVGCLEITSNTPGFTEEISKARAQYPDILIGAGTIINKTLAQQAIEAGAQFLVTPNTDKSIVKIAHKHNLPVLMGALTPTDIAKAINYNADFIKIFPAGTFGIKYFKDLQGPFSDTSFIPVGGINIDNISDWFNAGAIGVGIGNDLTRAVNNQEEQNILIALVKNYMEKIKILTK